MSFGDLFSPAARLASMALRLDAIVDDNIDTGDACGALPEIGLLPIVGSACRFDIDGVSRHATVGLGHQSGQFADASPRAGAMRVSEHDQRGAIGSQMDTASERPLSGGRYSRARSIFITPKQSKTSPDRQRPRCERGNQDSVSVGESH
jgi:hypothetical protein